MNQVKLTLWLVILPSSGYRTRVNVGYGYSKSSPYATSCTDGNRGKVYCIAKEEIRSRLSAIFMLNL
jgi:hypothetical protein